MEILFNLNRQYALTILAAMLLMLVASSCSSDKEEVKPSADTILATWKLHSTYYNDGQEEFSEEGSELGDIYWSFKENNDLIISWNWDDSANERRETYEYNASTKKLTVTDDDFSTTWDVTTLTASELVLESNRNGIVMRMSFNKAE